MRARILGAGVAGLACAVALRRRAHIEDIVLYERDRPAAGERTGHGLILMQNGLKALSALGVSHLLEGYTALTRALFQDASGAAVHAERLSDVYCVTRAGIVEGLSQALPDGLVEHGQSVDRVEMDPRSFRSAATPVESARVGGVHLRSGQVILDSDFDLLIGAEGYRSPLCDALNPGLERPVSRVMEIVTSSEIPTLAEQLGSSFVKTVFADRGLAFGLLSPTPTRVIGFLQFDGERYAPLARELGPDDFRRFLCEVLEGAPEPVPAYLRRASFETASLWRPVNSELPAHLHCDNAVLVGDAAHPLLPFTSQGVSAALEDAVILADVLGTMEPPGLPAALAGFCRDRRSDLRSYVDGGRRILAHFLDSSSSFVAPYVDGAASELEAHLSLPRGGLRALFRALDLDADGFLRRPEFASALRIFEFAASEAEVDALFAEIDADGSGQLTPEEVIVALTSREGGSELLRRIRSELSPRRVQVHTLKGRALSWFRLMDQDGDGAVDFEDFRASLLLVGLVVDRATSRELFDELDKNQDGKLDFAEFFAGASNRFALRRSHDGDKGPSGEDAVASLFANDAVNLSVLKQRAYNYRWAVQADGVIPLTAADPDFPVAREITDAIRDYLGAGYLSYGPAEGLPELRDIAAEKLRRKRNLDSDSGRVFVTDGAASGVFLVARLAIETPGQEAVIFDPVDFLLERSVVAAGGCVRRVRLRREAGYSFDPDELKAAIVPGRTRLLSICSPHNPLGRVWTEKELETLTEVAIVNDLWILSDEVWADIVYPPHVHLSTGSLAPEVAQRTFSVFGFSKSYGLAGLRLGLVVSPTLAAHQAIVQLSHAADTAYGVSTLSQVAAIAAYRSAEPWLDEFLAHLLRQRDYAVARLSSMKNVTCHTPEGTYVLFPSVSAVCDDTDALVAELRDRHGVAVVPGSPAFFGPGAAGHVRLSFATSRKILETGLDRLETGLAAIQSGGGARF